MLRPYGKGLRLGFTALVVALACAGTATPSRAEDRIRVERVQFSKGATSAVINGTLRGYQVVDYVLGASAGQYMNVSMATDNAAGYFNLLAPGETEVAFFNGSVSGNQYEGTLPATGDYRIRVYLMRSAARRGETLDYRLEVIVTGPSAKASTALAARTHVDATGKLPCAQHPGQPMGQCDFAVTRTGQGAATVVVTRPDGSARTIFFTNGRATGADATEAEGGTFSVQREGDLNLIRVDQERYEVPDAVVSGG